MDVNNSHLKRLIDKTDDAFKDLMREPQSSDLNQAYEQAKNELNRYLVSIRSQVKDRQSPNSER